MQAPEQRTKNALIHGVYASEILLSGESEEDFTELYKAFHGELNPGSPLEEEVVLDITRLHWLKRRAMHAARGESRVEPNDALEVRYKIINLAKTSPFFKAIRRIEVETLPVLERELEACASEQGRQDIGKCKRIFEQLKECQENYFNSKQESDREMSNATSVERTYYPADLERILKIEAMIDTRIEKALARLAGIKEFRRLYGQEAAPVRSV